MATQERINPDTLVWRRASAVWPDYRVASLDQPDDDPSGEAPGVWIKVLRGPGRVAGAGPGPWTVLLRYTAPPGKVLKVRAVARSDEEIWLLHSTDRPEAEGTYTCNPDGLRHGQVTGGTLVGLVRYAGAPDEILRMELAAPSEV